MRDFFKNQYVLHSLGALAVIVVLVAGFLFWLKGYTRHDQTTPTPDLQGMDATLAVQTLEAMGFRWTIIDSSRYEPDKRPRAVLSQDPSAGTAVKEGRKIYLKINRSSWETVSVPTVDFENDKIENVAKRLQAVGFIVGDTIYLDAGEVDASMYSAIQQVFDNTCAQCHGLSTTAAAGLYLTGERSHADLVGQPATTVEGTRVIPGDAEASVLHKVINPGNEAGLGFSHEGMINSSATLRLVDEWINAGAKE